MNEHRTGGKEKLGVAYPDMLKMVENSGDLVSKTKSTQKRRRNSTGFRPHNDMLAVCLPHEEAV